MKCSRIICFVLQVTAVMAVAQTPFIYTCVEDDKISPATKNAVDKAAQIFVEKLISSDPDDLYSFLSVGAKENSTTAAMAQAALYSRSLELKNLQTRHTYLISLAGTSPGRVFCAQDISKSEGRESVSANSEPEQAHVLISAEGINNSFVFAVWLLPEKQEWKIQGFWLNAASLGKLDTDELLRMARSEQAKKHRFNALLLYVAAEQLTNRGPYFQMGIAEKIRGEGVNLEIPDEVKGGPPFIWKKGETTFRVLRYGPMAIGGKVYVTIDQEVEPWSSEKEPDDSNKGLIAFMKFKFPEYSDVFAGIVARAHEHGTNRGFTTVDEVTAKK